MSLAAETLEVIAPGKAARLSYRLPLPAVAPKEKGNYPVNVRSFREVGQTAEAADAR